MARVYLPDTEQISGVGLTTVTGSARVTNADTDTAVNLYSARTAGTTVSTGVTPLVAGRPTYPWVDSGATLKIYVTPSGQAEQGPFYFEATTGAAASSSTSTFSYAWKPTAWIGENIPTGRFTVLGNQGVPVLGTLRLIPMGVLSAGIPVASVTFLIGTTSAVSLTNQWAGIVRVSDLQLMAVSADKTSEAWTTSTNALKTFPMATAYTPSVDELAYACLAVTGTTAPSLNGLTVNGTLEALTPPLGGNSSTGMTGPLTVGATVTAPAVSVSMPYCAWS